MNERQVTRERLLPPSLLPAKALGQRTPTMMEFLIC